jgi:hypothetical protein
MATARLTIDRIASCWFKGRSHDLPALQPVSSKRCTGDFPDRSTRWAAEHDAREVGAIKWAAAGNEEAPSRGALGPLGKGCLAVTYSRMGRPHTTIGAGRFHFRVRDGVGWFPPAVAARQNRSADARVSGWVAAASHCRRGGLAGTSRSTPAPPSRATPWCSFSPLTLAKRLGVIWSSLTGH